MDTSKGTMSNRKHTQQDETQIERGARRLQEWSAKSESEQQAHLNAPQPAKAARNLIEAEREEREHELYGRRKLRVEQIDHQRCAYKLVATQAELERVTAERDELLAACKHGERLLNEIVFCTGGTDAQVTLAQLRAAIAKAEGRAE